MLLSSKLLLVFSRNTLLPGEGRLTARGRLLLRAHQAEGGLALGGDGVGLVDHHHHGLERLEAHARHPSRPNRHGGGRRATRTRLAHTTLTGGDYTPVLITLWGNASVVWATAVSFDSKIRAGVERRAVRHGEASGVPGTEQQVVPLPAPQVLPAVCRALTLPAPLVPCHHAGASLQVQFA